MSPATRLALALALIVCPQAPAQKLPQEMAFPSGRKVKILSIQDVETKDENARLGNMLILEYETKLKITDAVALLKEIDEIWTWFRKDADHRKMTVAAMTAVAPAPGDQVISRALFKKQRDGSWKKQPRQ